MGSGARPPTYKVGTGRLFPREQSSGGVKLITHLHLMLRTRMVDQYLKTPPCLNGVIPPTDVYEPLCNTDATHYFFSINVAKFLFGERLRCATMYPTSHETFILNRRRGGGVQVPFGRLMAVVGSRHDRRYRWLAHTLLQ
jgi:hypothetical protein